MPPASDDGDGGARAAAPAPVPAPFPTSLCHRCRYLRRVESKRGSVFLSCTEPSLPRYLPQPVLRCGGFAGRDDRCDTSEP